MTDSKQTCTHMTKTYGVAIQDTFDHWNAPLSTGKTRKDARGYANFLLVNGWSNTYGEIKAVQVVETTGGYEATRAAVKALNSGCCGRQSAGFPLQWGT